MDERSVQTWLDRYIEAWRTNDAGTIAELFGRDAQYRYHPADDPIVGPAEIAASWLAHPDEPGSWDAWYRPYTVDDDRAVATGISTYLQDDGTVDRVFDNVFLLRFDEADRCVAFTEWFVERPEGRVDAPAPAGGDPAD